MATIHSRCCLYSIPLIVLGLPGLPASRTLHWLLLLFRFCLLVQQAYLPVFMLTFWQQLQELALGEDYTDFRGSEIQAYSAVGPSRGKRGVKFPAGATTGFGAGV